MRFRLWIPMPTQLSRSASDLLLRITPFFVLWFVRERGLSALLCPTWKTLASFVFDACLLM